MEPVRKLHPGMIALIVIALIAIAATAVVIIQDSSTKKGDASSQTTDTIDEKAPPSNATSETTTSTYKDGTYSATGRYSSPGGRESVDLTVTIEGGVITSTSLKTNATDGDAEEYQGKFASAYKRLVVGKKVDEVTLTRVAGSSLTSNGFNTALDQIRTDAQS